MTMKVYNNNLMVLLEEVSRNTSILASGIGNVRASTAGIEELLSQRDFITPDSVMVTDPNIILSRAYPLVEVARIAAGCAGSSDQERILNALRLLAAAEGIANPDPWASQSDNVVADEKYDSMIDLHSKALEIVAACTDGKGTQRNEVLSGVYQWLGRKGSQNAQNKAYMKWADAAAAECAEITAWRDYVSKHPEKHTPESCSAWRKKWRSKRAKFDAGKFLKRLERPSVNGATAYFLDQQAALTALIGDDSGDFTPLLEAWIGPRERDLLRDPETRQFVARGDRKNRATRENHQK